MSKRRKVSEIVGGKLKAMRQSIRAICDAISEGAIDKNELIELRELLETPEKALDLSFSSIKAADLADLGIAEAGLLELKLEGHEERLKEVEAAGKDKAWTSELIFRHLDEVVLDSASGYHEANSCVWIDAFWFRISAMARQGEMLVLSLERCILPMAISPLSSITVHGYLDYIGISTDKSNEANAKHMLLSDPNLPKSPSFHGVLVIEAKGSNAVPLETHIPQVVAEMLACAKIQEKRSIRGVLTTGRTWIFIALVIRDGSAEYWLSSPFELCLPAKPPGKITIAPQAPDLIAGILMDLLRCSFDNIEDGDDWFEARRIQRG